jgi:uncharacterized protein YdeI (YjbR/CyaY-like superfamily)
MSYIDGSTRGTDEARANHGYFQVPTNAQQEPSADTVASSPSVEPHVQFESAQAQVEEPTYATSAEAVATSGSAPDFDELMSNPDKLVDLYDDDPAAFTEFFKGLSSDDREAMTTRLNRQMQQDNQLFTLISNLLQASHQTARAVIQNLRV